MKNLRLKPLLYEDECEHHGITPFIVEQQSADFVEKKISFVFYCKKCWHIFKENTPAWSATLTFDQYNNMFGFTESPDN